MKNKPLVLHTDWSKSWGGQEIRTITELVEIRERGFRVALVVREGAELARRAEALAIDVYFVDFSSKFNLSAWYQLFKLLRRLQPAVVNTHSSEDSWMAGAVARILNVPLVIKTRHVLESISSAVSYNLFPHLIWACSESIRDQLVAQGVREGKIAVQPTGVDESRFCFSPEDRVEIRKKYNVDEDTILVGNVSFLRHYKGHEFIISVVPLLPQNFSFIFVGGGDARAELEKKAMAAGVADRVIFAGHQEEPERFFSAFDIVFFASYQTEGVSQAFVQGLLYGLPLLCCQTPSLLEPLQMVKNYKLIEYGDRDAAVGGLLKLSANLQRDEEQALVQRNELVQKYGLKAMMDNIVATYGRHGVKIAD